MMRLRRLAAGWAFAAASLSPAVVRGQTSAVRPDTAEVRTEASAQRSVRPNQASLTLQFTAEDSTPHLAGQRLAQRADNVRQALMALGIPRDSLVTGSSWYWWPERLVALPHPRLIRATPPGRGLWQAVDTVPGLDGSVDYRPIFDTTYRAREILEVRLGDATRVGAVIDAALALRITEISGIRFRASDVREARVAALREATALAREQAEAIASASGGRLGRVLLLSTQAEYMPRYGELTLNEAGVSGQVGNPGTEITAPSVTVTVTVYGRWQLRDH
jgi:uncharacterized protein YggE